MRLRLAVGAAALLSLVAVFTLYVVAVAGLELFAARSVLRGSPQELDEEEAGRARGHLVRAVERLDGVPARFLRIVPVVGANLGALQDSVEAFIPVLDGGLALRSSARPLLDEGLMLDGRVRLEALEDLRAPLADQIQSLDRLVERVREHRHGLLAPLLWDALDELLRRGGELRIDARRLQRVLEMSDPLLGADGNRTYLLISINNAELRGSGGLLSGLGTITVADGRIEIGELFAREALTTRPRHRVPAPPDYERRFAHYGANTTLWANTTYSPDFTEVAIVAARLFERVTGIETDGAIQMDPHGLAALVPRDAVIDVPGLGQSITSDEIPGWIYSDAYAEFRNHAVRRETIIEVGRAALDLALSSGFGGENALDRISAAVSGGHIRFVPFHPDERAALDALGVTGEMEDVPADGLLVAVQNLGGGPSGPGGSLEGSKLDYWARRTVRHACTVQDTSATCRVGTTLTNETPGGLTRYVAGVPYGTLRSYVELYVPREAVLHEVTLDERPAEFRAEDHGKRTSIAVYVEIPPGENAEVDALYSLPLESRRYSLAATPQPLTHDADIELALRVPGNWAVEGPLERTEDGLYRFAGTFDRSIHVEAKPSERTGFPALWNRLVRFWREPLL